MEAEAGAAQLTPLNKAAPAPVSRRVFLMMLAGISLLTGLDAGLVRLGVWAPVANGRLADLHGPLMVLGFMGSLISLERAQALRNRLAYAAPALLGAGALVMISGVFPVLGKLLLFDGALAFVAVMVALYRRAPLPLVGAQVVGAVLACLAAALLPLLAGFIVVTIAAERAELAQLTMGRRAVPTLVAASAWLSLSAVSALLWPGFGDRIFGVGVLFVALWLIRDDVGRRLIRSEGLRRYNAAALLLGNIWLAVAGLTWVIVGRPEAVGTYDVVVHGTFLGFAMSMIMAHAPIIFPTVLSRPLPYRPAMWVPLTVLHLGMVVRVLGALTGSVLYQIGGAMTVVSILLFAATAMYSAVRA